MFWKNLNCNQSKGTNMKCYIVCFEISDDRYQTFLEKIRTYPKWAIITRGTCAIASEDQTIKIRDDLSALLNNSERLFIMPSSHVAAWRNSICKGEWLKENL